MAPSVETVTNYFMTHAFEIIIDLSVVAPCIAIILSCICRIDKLNVRAGSSYLWHVKYIAIAAYAGGVALDWFFARNVEWFHVMGLIGIGLHIYLTMSHWKDDYESPPIDTQRGALL